MPKSKRNKVAALTWTEKKGKVEKMILFDKVRAAVDANTHAYIISVSNMRNSILKTMRTGLKHDSSSANSSVAFFFGNNRVIAKSLGRPDREHEYKDGLRFLGENLKVDAKKTRHYSAFSEYTYIDVARNGVKATKTVTIQAGPVIRRVEAVDIGEIDESLAPSYLPESSSSGTRCYYMAKFNVLIVGHWSEDVGYENVDGIAENDDADDDKDEAVEMDDE
ncbi:mRNA turnover 4 [Physocladia obscura]|uniref:mRNA turnover 4 n=1 Tax=Physocladia obscura TaxID=109957 RepID=A0AAD5XKV3_9FUNG|nr:mRNA turnover 4 [Physocladia obscura]